ncbi:3-keto-5-aminohexanoate cleavage protein [Mycolicibacterium phlei]|uniref:3-keto-5-aminohexanoate cleavage protein n=1 Tax=Mycolicibacterium phlei DSM 43239 = CCUG 21000 TaxID=1226750 RepID=A0A5N5VCL0_MYCPH|nr:3-keto-5-aminohexanoate cleavage protein [Mycolicibacterium phlei]VEG11563.1 3-keto-5-aminohexanoate cleavage protein [Mycobacteroides chelonae]AMO63469.1 3-keto-5-aminohexanoate cleavage enzyme [Mycolicibacterium phlei]KAB7759681.1 3-keto-5-aminohexanoate cleavage protein [Mycolicibacterium phlei DSM 43239 = CCUG 21000]KXW62502.1 3-keto-5-aminohexanoate cleavage protein [Mycolicibacterium phlei DSM 43070]KXW68726.1 3-keto-5-aminohexanoate cleavage protein [Mycolicibacterium phlei DSM 43239
MSGVFITVAPTGAESGKDDNPHIPLQPEEIVAEAVACERAGAALIHIHGRDRSGAPTLDLGILGEIVAGVREQTNLIVQLSTGGSVHDPFADRLRVLELQPESCSLTCGTVNFGADVFSNPLPFIEELYQAALERRVLPEFELFDFGHIATLHRLLDRYGPPAQGVVHCNLVMGVPGGMPGDPRTLVAAQSQLPQGCSWSATGIGRTALPVLLTAMALGGNVRVGMEDVLRFSATELVSSNVQLVERAAEVARIGQHDLMDAARTRAVLGLAEPG